MLLWLHFTLALCCHICKLVKHKLKNTTVSFHIPTNPSIHTCTHTTAVCFYYRRISPYLTLLMLNSSLYAVFVIIDCKHYLLHIQTTANMHQKANYGMSGQSFRFGISFLRFILNYTRILNQLLKQHTVLLLYFCQC